MRWFGLLFILMLIGHRAVQAQDYSLEATIQSLKGQGRVSFTLIPTMHLYKDLCEEGSIAPQSTQQLTQVCESVVQSPVCQRVAAKDRLQCDVIEQESQVSLWAFLEGCIEGGLNSVTEILNFFWESVQWVWQQASSSEARSKAWAQANEYIQVVRLYLHTEFAKAYASQESPFKAAKALTEMGGAISGLILGLLSDMITDHYQEFGCLSFQAKSEVLCEFIGTALVPLGAGTALIKFGPKAMDSFPNLNKAFANLDALSEEGKEKLKQGLLTTVGRRNLSIRDINAGKAVQRDFTQSLSEELGENGVTAFANQYEVSFREKGELRSIHLDIPVKPNLKTDKATLRRLKKVLSQMPAAALKEVDLIVVNPGRSVSDKRFEKTFGQKDFRAAMTVSIQEGARVVDIYPGGFQTQAVKQVASDLRHELGHILAIEKYGDQTPDENWSRAINQDDNSVSEYGDTFNSEDFAEAMRVYFETDGGTRKPQMLKEYANRFKILDEIMQVDANVRKEIIEKLEQRMSQRGIYWTTATTVTGVHVNSLTIDDRIMLFEEDLSESEP